MHRISCRSALRYGLLFSLCLMARPVFGSDDTAAFIRKYLDVATATSLSGYPHAELTSLRAFYAKRKYKPVWVVAGSSSGRARAVLAVLNTAPSHGLDKDDYSARQIARSLGAGTSVQGAQLDILLSKAVARYGADLAGLHESRPSATKHSEKPTSHHSYESLLQKAAAAGNLRAFFDGLAPRSPRYERLRDALTDYRQIAGRGGWPRVATGPLLRRNMRTDRIRMLRRRLVVTRDLYAGTHQGDLFDGEIEAAVRRFQRRHGLAEDGVVGPKTRAALNIPVAQRIQQIRVNLQRRRSIPDNLGPHYVFVNMADFNLKAVKEGRTVLTMKVVVGTPYRQTPLFTANMTYVDFNPYWNIPRRIALEEIVPRARRDPAYLHRQGIRIFTGWDAQARELPPQEVNWFDVGTRPFPYRLRQDPGPRNPLGRVKFMFPNLHEVYLHDTPARDLFNRTVRTFSHGCIRIEKPVELAAHLLPELSGANVKQIMADGKRGIFKLREAVPVYLSYLTAWVNKDGTVHFREDIYSRDGHPAAAMRR
jgi:murein L,D-transpeptidase YcbB/YkuD